MTRAPQTTLWKLLPSSCVSPVLEWVPAESDEELHKELQRSGSEECQLAAWCLELQTTENRNGIDKPPAVTGYFFFVFFFFFLFCFVFINQSPN